MNPFYQNIGSFPTVFFTFFLGIAVFFWAVAVLGLVDIDILDIDVPEGDMDGGSSPDALAGLLMKFGLQGVPVTVVISFIALFGWLCSYYLVHFIFPWLSEGILHYLIGLPILLVSLYCAAMVTAWVIKPMRPFFKHANEETIKRVLGQIAIVRSSVVDHAFGEAVLADGGAGLIFKVRPYKEETFVKGDRVVLLEFNKESNIYRVISEKEFLHN